MGAHYCVFYGAVRVYHLGRQQHWNGPGLNGWCIAVERVTNGTHTQWLCCCPL
jgi:hypothetical protein